MSHVCFLPPSLSPYLSPSLAPFELDYHSNQALMVDRRLQVNVLTFGSSSKINYFCMHLKISLLIVAELLHWCLLSLGEHGLLDPTRADHNISQLRR